MQLVDDSRAVRRACDAERRLGRRVGFVPTMGYLHQGHLSLIHRARELSDFVVVSIFVNPTQFGPNEDLDRYPRDPEGDARRCQRAGAALLFTPEASAIYPAGFQTYVEVERLTRGACGDRRPGHFRGVCTVVAKLLNIVGPCAAVFGRKDYQQLLVIERMVADLAMPVDVVGAETVREDDGLARSSRNAYLDADQRQAATCLFRALTAVREAVAGGPLPADEAIARVSEELERSGARIDYVELRQAKTFEPVDVARTGEAVMLIAAFIGQTRLIDNMIL